MGKHGIIQHFQRGDLQRAEQEARAELAHREDADLRHLLGLIHCRRGQIAEGAAELGRALELAPGHPGIRTGYVRALIDSGQADLALRHARRPAPGPAAEDLWRLRAEAAEAAGEPADLAEALHYLDLERNTRELESRPDDLHLQLRQGRLFGVLGRKDDAEQTYRKILSGHPSNAEAAYELAVLLERQNRLAEVRKLIDESVRAGADPADFAFCEALLAWRSRNARCVIDWLDKAPIADPVWASHLRAKAYDLLDQPDAAFRAAQEMSRLTPDRDRWRRRAARYRDQLRKDAELITPQWAAALGPPARAPGPQPAFLVGFPRSGTTLLDTYLLGHPEVEVLEEVPILGLLAERVGTLEALPKLDESTAEKLRHSYWSRVRPRLSNDFKGLVVDKLPLNMLNAPLISRLFPQAKIIFAQRHPCDCVLSAYFQNFGLNPAMASFLDIRDAADLYDAAMTLWTRSRDALPLDVHTIAYERLVEQPEKVLGPLIRFLGLGWDARLLDHRATAQKRGEIGTPSYDQVTLPITTGPVERWTRYRRQMESALPTLLPWAQRLGYSNRP